MITTPGPVTWTVELSCEPFSVTRPDRLAGQRMGINEWTLPLDSGALSFQDVCCTDILSPMFMKKIARKSFLQGLFTAAVVPASLLLLDRLSASPTRQRHLRPPGAQPEDEFLSRCIGCASCAQVCRNNCISLFDLNAGLKKLGTPVINARAKACILCMACTQACPTGALTKTPPTQEGRESIQMGKAYISTDICYSYAGRTCGVCFRACPLAGKALTVDLFEVPKVHLEHCVGCGLCESACIHMPQAIRVIPTEELNKRS